jgi:hypothetical protein
MAMLVGLVNMGSEAKSWTFSPGYTFKSAREDSGECSPVSIRPQEATTIKVNTRSVFEVIEDISV